MTATTLPETNLRNSRLPELVELLKQQADVKYDVVVPAGRLRYEDGILVVAGGAARISDDGVEECDARLRPTEVCEDGISEKLAIPRAYLRRLRETPTRLWDPIMAYPGGEVGAELLLDATVNAFFHDNPNRRVLVRGFRVDDPDETGIARAFLSDSYGIIDNYDVLLAALAGVREAGVNVEITRAELTERRMRVQVVAPEVAAMAPTLLDGYRSPYKVTGVPGGDTHDRSGGGTGAADLPVVFAGFEIRNSETGGGAFSIVPRIVVKICDNGLTKTVDALRSVHLGGRLEEGPVRWSDETRQRAVELVSAKARDAVATFLDVEYVKRFVATIEEKSATPVSDAVATIERVAKIHAFSEAESASILDCFIKSGDLTAGGVMQAVTAAAQRVDSPDRAADLEDVALDVLATAAA